MKTESVHAAARSGVKVGKRKEKTRWFM